MSEFSIIGKPIALVDSAGKTTGQGKYTDDLCVPGMLMGKILHSPYPHAKIKNIDASRALALPGVVTVVTGQDAPNKYGILPVGHDETALAVEKVRYVGDNVACVVAESESIADQAPLVGPIATAARLSTHPCAGTSSFPRTSRHKRQSGSAYSRYSSVQTGEAPGRIAEPPGGSVRLWCDHLTVR